MIPGHHPVYRRITHLRYRSQFGGRRPAARVYGADVPQGTTTYNLIASTRSAPVKPTPPVVGGNVWTPVRPGGLGPVILLLTLLARVGGVGCRGSHLASDSAYVALVTLTLALSCGVPQPSALHHRSPIGVRPGTV